METWILGVELNGEWEQCTFRSRQEALASFAALTSDYPVKIGKAILVQKERALDYLATEGNSNT